MARPLPRAPRTQTTMRFPVDLLERLDALAAERGITRSHLVEKALSDFVSAEQARKESAA